MFAEERSRPCRSTLTSLPESVSNRTRQGRGRNSALPLPLLKFLFTFRRAMVGGGGCQIRATSSTGLRYASLLQPMETATWQLTQIFDSLRQREHEDFYDLFLQSPCHQDHGGASLRRRRRAEAEFGDVSVSFRSRQSRQQIPATQNFIGSVGMFVKDSDSRSDMTSEYARSSTPRQTSSGILHHTASKKEVLPATEGRPPASRN